MFRNEFNKPTDLLGSRSHQLHKRRLKQFKQTKGANEADVPTDEQKFWDLYIKTMGRNEIYPRIGKNEKNNHTFKFTYRDQTKDFDWPDIQSEGKTIQVPSVSIMIDNMPNFMIN